MSHRQGELLTAILICFESGLTVVKLLFYTMARFFLTYNIGTVHALPSTPGDLVYWTTCNGTISLLSIFSTNHMPTKKCYFM